MLNEDEKDLVWLPKQLASEVKQIQDDKVKEHLIIKYIDESKREIQANLDSLDEDVIRYKGLMLKAKKAFEEAKTEQLTASYQLWEKLEDDLPKTSEKVDKVKALILPLKNELDSVRQLCQQVSGYDLERLLEIVKELNQHLAYGGETANILKFLFENYKK